MLCVRRDGSGAARPSPPTPFDPEAAPTALRGVLDLLMRVGLLTLQLLEATLFFCACRDLHTSECEFGE